MSMGEIQTTASAVKFAYNSYVYSSCCITSPTSQEGPSLDERGQHLLQMLAPPAACGLAAAELLLSVVCSHGTQTELPPTGRPAEDNNGQNMLAVNEVDSLLVSRGHEATCMSRVY